MVRPSSQAPAILFPFGIYSRAFRRPDGGLLLRVLEALELSPDVGLLAWSRRPPHRHPRSQPSWAVPPTQPPREPGVSPPTTASNNSPPRDAGLRQRLRHHLPPLPSTSISQAIPAGGADDASPLCQIRQRLPRPSGSDASQATTRGEGTKIRVSSLASIPLPQTNALQVVRLLIIFSLHRFCATVYVLEPHGIKSRRWEQDGANVCH